MSEDQATVSRLKDVLDQSSREERLARLSPEARATYERIRKLREAIGPVDFEIVAALREIRENG
jgi:hypothetical protein